MEQLAPRGDAGGFLTPGRVCSSPDACSPPGREDCMVLHLQLGKFGRVKGKMGFSKQQGGYFGAAAWQTPSPVRRGAPRRGVSPLALRATRIPRGKSWQDVKKKSVQLNLKHPSNHTHSVFLPFGGLFYTFLTLLLLLACSAVQIGKAVLK